MAPKWCHYNCLQQMSDCQKFWMCISQCESIHERCQLTNWFKYSMKLCLISSDIHYLITQRTCIRLLVMLNIVRFMLYSVACNKPIMWCSGCRAALEKIYMAIYYYLLFDSVGVSTYSMLQNLHGNKCKHFWKINIVMDIYGTEECLFYIIWHIKLSVLLLLF